MAYASRKLQNVNTDQVVRLLGRAGWTERVSSGSSHRVLTKPGHDAITIADPISLNQWSNLRATVGMELKTLITRRKALGRGKRLREDEWKERINFGKQLYSVGFGYADVVRYASLPMLPKLGVGMKEFRDSTTEQLLDKYIRPQVLQQPTSVLKLGAVDPRSNGPVIQVIPPRRVEVEVAAPEVETEDEVQVEQPVAVTPATPTTATPRTQPATDDAMLELLGEMHDTIEQLKSDRFDAGARYHERLRLVTNVARRLKEQHDATGERLNGLLSLLRDFD